MSRLFRDFILPLLLMTEIGFSSWFGPLVPVSVKAFLYSLSLLMKESLILVLPFIIFSFLVQSLSSLRKGSLAFFFILSIFGLVCISNFMSTSLAGILGMLTLDNLVSLDRAVPSSPLLPLWTFSFPRLISNDMALFLGSLGGLFLSFFRNNPFQKGILLMQQGSLFFLKHIYIPLVPVFILGFILKIQHEGTLGIILNNYWFLGTLISLYVFGYIVLLYGGGTRFHLPTWGRALQRMFPAVLTGFSTMSSASALPLIIDGVEKNTLSSLGRGIVPMTVNIHLMGDCFFISMLALAILASSGHGLPSIENYLIFTCFFVIAKFAVAAVPGGGILVMLPILEKYLGFSAEMLSLMTALYILFDPIITSANVLGNGAFSLLLIKIYKTWGSKNPSSQV